MWHYELICLAVGAIDLAISVYPKETASIGPPIIDERMSIRKEPRAGIDTSYIILGLNSVITY
jgi:hypothetical protein